MAVVPAAADVYEQGKAGLWDPVLAVLASSDAFARECAHFAKPTSGWTLLHQAAYFGHEGAMLRLLALGADPEARSRGDECAVDVALRRGHPDFADRLRGLTLGSLWAAPETAEHLPSSNRWGEAQRREADRDLRVRYAGGDVRIPQGGTFYADSIGRVLVGWHGTYDPPRDMDGDSILEGA